MLTVTSDRVMVETSAGSSRAIRSADWAVARPQPGAARYRRSGGQLHAPATRVMELAEPGDGLLPPTRRFRTRS
jgi:hypothetical protein